MQILLQLGCSCNVATAAPVTCTSIYVYVTYISTMRVWHACACTTICATSRLLPAIVTRMYISISSADPAVSESSFELHALCIDIHSIYPLADQRECVLHFASISVRPDLIKVYCNEKKHYFVSKSQYEDLLELQLFRLDSNACCEMLVQHYMRNPAGSRLAQPRRKTV